ncbi:hypothetical protein [uncultured Duncaniella sp.]|jgi:hypothetical protein|uniref:hypothetical protein n=1 Tax=uncultured Duncaniella sp. TaxID=2768039 RepID=UPI0026772018|nr:hypothetical protein [uncultured Duncaniella sp.]
MNLIDAIKDLISKKGISVVDTKQFVNVLDDVGAFKNEPAASKKVMKGLMDSGFGALVLQYSKKKESNWQNVVRKAVADYASKSGYKDELINNIAAAILYSAGVISELPKTETASASRSSVANPSKNQIKDPKELMYALKKEYVSALKEFLTIKSDEFGFNYGFFSTEANTKLYVIESKIKLVARELDDRDIERWLYNERQKVLDQNRPSASDVNRALNDIMSNLIREYRAEMEKGCSIEDDEFGLKSACFHPNVVSDLLAIEKKIIAIGKRKNENKQSWIDKTKSDFLASKSSPISARNGVLDQLKNEYLTKLNSLDKETKTGEIDFSDSELSEIRRKLINLGTLLNQNMVTWCDSENNHVTEEREKRFSKRKKRNVIISSVAGLALIIGGGNLISYTSSSDARATYEATMTSGNTEMSKGNYAAAITLFQKAENEYDASYSSSTYKKEAHSKAAEASDKVIAEWVNQVTPLIKEVRPAKAKLLTMALPTNLVLEGSSEDTYKNITQQIDNSLSTRTSAIVDQLLNEIYTNNGKLSESSKQELDEMIEVISDNYWLNFIKEKSK